MENGKKKKRPKRFPAEIQAMVDGGRMLYSIIVSIVAAVVEAGGNSEHIRRLDQPEGKSVICQIADLIVGKAALVAAVTQYSFDDLFDAFQQHDYGDTEFTESRWPLEPVALDENDWEVVEHRFAKNLTIKEGLRRLTKMADEGKIRLLAGSRRAMEWVAPHLDDGLIHPAILPLCAQDSDGKWVVPVFGLMWHDGSCQPGMTLYDLDEMTYPAHRWLVLRRIQPSPARKKQTNPASARLRFNFEVRLMRVFFILLNLIFFVRIKMILRACSPDVPTLRRESGSRFPR